MSRAAAVQRFNWPALLKLLATSAAAWAAVAVCCTLVGSTGTVGVPSKDVFWLRVNDHVLIASLVGAALAAAGVAYQAILRNPLADPYLLGVSGGATVASYGWRLASFGGSSVLLAISPPVAALVGSLAAVAIVLAAAGRGGRLEPVRAILVGVVVNSMCGSGFLLLNALFRDLPAAGSALTYLSGDIQTTASHGQIVAASVAIAIGWLLMLAMTPLLNVVRLSEDEAASLGLRVQRARWCGLIAASLMTAAAVAVSGPIGFVGLICPHAARWMVGNDNRRLLPVATALGAIALVGADAIARTLLGTPHVATLIPVGVITALVGGPFVLLILARMKR